LVFSLVRTPLMLDLALIGHGGKVWKGTLGLAFQCVLLRCLEEQVVTNSSALLPSIARHTFKGVDVMLAIERDAL
jgi:hypothetical protein